VLNSRGYTQAAWWNRIPLGAWLLMWLVAIAINLMVGYSERRTTEMTLLVLPSIVAVALFSFQILTVRGTASFACRHKTPLQWLKA
jgi:protein-S-isoprenylcysteine O-methyltransferase Ste14